MSLREKVNQIIITLARESEDWLKDIDSTAGLSSEEKDALTEMINRNLLPALKAANFNINNDREPCDFIEPLAFALTTSGIISGMLRKGVIFTEKMSTYAKKKSETDPKQQAKISVKAYWSRWQKEPTLYIKKSNFAKDMLEKHETLVSQKKIEDWCRDWEKESLSQLNEH